MGARSREDTRCPARPYDRAVADDEQRYELPPTTFVAVEEQSRPLALAVAAGLVAALVGAVAWALIVKWTDYEIGIAAWGIGLLSGAAVALAAGRARGPVLQAIAVASALVGILLGKYLSYAMVVQDEAKEAGVDLGLFSGEIREFFRDDLGDVFGLFDLLFVGLAVYTAWRALQPEREPDAQPV